MKTMRIVLVLAALLVPASAFAQSTPTKNPTTVQFVVSTDHAQVTSYELDLVRASDDAVVQTLSLGKPTPDATSTAQVTINVQPIAFGTYYGVMRAVAGTAKSTNSAPSNQFERAPGAPSKVVF